MSSLESSQDLEQWFQERPIWMQEAAYRIISKGNLSGADYQELLDMCLNEAAKVPVQCNRLTEGVFDVQESPIHLRLESISEVKGINALSPSKPLEFGKSQICLVRKSFEKWIPGHQMIIKKRIIGKIELH